MATKDIKVGNFYHVLVKVLDINPINGEITTETANEFGTSLNKEPTYFARCEKEAFFPITPENDRKNSEPAPKYDTCRLFRKGDKVRVVEWNGRKYYDYDHHTELKTGCIAEIWENEKDEQEEGFVSVMFEEHIRCVPPCYLELITPVEEIEPWVIDEGDPHFWGIVKIAGKFPVMLPRDYYTREQAEAECERLNAEHRKEQNND